MRSRDVVLVLAASAAVAVPARAQAPADHFFGSVKALCGQAFDGRIVANEPPPATADPFDGKRLVFHVRGCGDDRLELPFHVGDDRSRTWVLTRRGSTLELKHDHRHEDGTPDALTMYGGLTKDPGTAIRQEFPADVETKDLFTRQDLLVSVPNTWAMEIHDGRRFVYELARPGRLFRVEFDLTRPVTPPPAPWGHEAAALPADHHVHVLGPGLLRDWKSLGVPFSRPDAAYLSAQPVLEGEGRVEQALLVPMAHLYGNEELRGGLKLSVEEEWARVRDENDHVAAEAARWPGRAVAFCSVDWRRTYAWDELRRCRAELASPGIKLHLASAGTDLRDAVHRRELARIMAWAEAQGLAVLLHVDPQLRGTTTADVERFITDVLGPHPRLQVTVAHLGGSGGYGPWTRSVLGVFTAWLAQERAAGRGRSGVLFDVSAVLLEKESEGVPATTAAEARALGEDLRRLGLARVVFASDYPVFSARRSAELLAARTGLTPHEVEQVKRNRAPVLLGR